MTTSGWSSRWRRKCRPGSRWTDLLWLVANRPSTIARSAGVGWIAVKFKDKGKKVLEAKAAWDRYEGGKTVEVVNKLAKEYHVMGGKWMFHLPSGLIDYVWPHVRGAGAQYVHGQGQPNVARGEHVICVYNADILLENLSNVIPKSLKIQLMFIFSFRHLCDQVIYRYVMTCSTPKRTEGLALLSEGCKVVEE